MEAGERERMPKNNGRLFAYKETLLLAIFLKCINTRVGRDVRRKIPSRVFLSLFPSLSNKIDVLKRSVSRGRTGHARCASDYLLYDLIVATRLDKGAESEEEVIELGGGETSRADSCALSRSAERKRTKIWLREHLHRLFSRGSLMPIIGPLAEETVENES